MTISRKNLGFFFHPKRRQLPEPGKVRFPRVYPSSSSHMTFLWRIVVLGCQDNTHQLWKWGRDLCRAEISELELGQTMGGLVAEPNTAGAGPGWGCREWRCLEASFRHGPTEVDEMTACTVLLPSDLCLSWTLQYKHYSQSHDSLRKQNEQQGSSPRHKPQGYICCYVIKTQNCCRLYWLVIAPSSAPMARGHNKLSTEHLF